MDRLRNRLWYGPVNMDNRISKGAHGVIVIVVGNGHGDTSSNPGPD